MICVLPIVEAFVQCLHDLSTAYTNKHYVCISVYTYVSTYLLLPIVPKGLGTIGTSLLRLYIPIVTYYVSTYLLLPTTSLLRLYIPIDVPIVPKPFVLTYCHLLSTSVYMYIPIVSHLGCCSGTLNPSGLCVCVCVRVCTCV